MVEGLKGKTYKEWLRSLGFFSLKRRRLRDDLVTVYNFFKGVSRGVCGDLSLVTSNGTLGNGIKLCQGKFSFAIKKSFFSKRVDSHWNRFPNGMVRAPSLSEFKEYVDNALSHML
ncbi:hypothetical protein BTVI_65888 [Pitangus sulphuratus]|nr:hypothetical protein BTVI_65888 [Pitangus sulphuratus]